jgi:hypothetical protein
MDVITLLQKSSFNPELIRAYAQRQRAQNLLVGELTRLLEPAPEFTKLAIANIETRNLTQAVVESWKQTVASAVDEWARQRMLTAALSEPQRASAEESTKVVTTKEELEAFDTISKLLGPGMPVEFEDTVSYFKIHVAGKRTWVTTRLQLDRKQPIVWVPLPVESVQALSGGRTISTISGWTVVTLDQISDISQLGELLRSAYSTVLTERGG